MAVLASKSDQFWAGLGQLPAMNMATLSQARTDQGWVYSRVRKVHRSEQTLLVCAGTAWIPTTHIYALAPLEALLKHGHMLFWHSHGDHSDLGDIFFT